MITKTQYKWALEARKIYIIGTKFTRNGWTEFKVYRLAHNQLEPVIVEKSPYWSKTAYAYKCTAWGTSRVLEIILSIGYTLGLEFNEIHQRYNELN